MNTPDQTAQSLIDLAIHAASVPFHNPAVTLLSTTSAVSASMDDHFLVSEALIERLVPRGAAVTIADRGRLTAVWQHTTKNGHTYLCRLKLIPPGSVVV